VADDEKEAIEIANDSKFGLGAIIWTQNLEKAEELSSMVESGMVTVNNVMISETLLFFLVV
jgi:acyl-CoA reductase-like NAD-dependent aldehyde dehydrogenase